jgi:hypothetical protein
MTAPTKSAYPVSVEDLVPRARALADRVGGVPSRNLLMKELRVGAPKATALVEALQRNGSTPPDPTTDPPPAPVLAPELPDPPAGPTAGTDPDRPAVVAAPSPLAVADGHPDPPTVTPPAPPGRRVRRPVAWPVWFLAAPAFVAIWSGWVELGGLAGFGVVSPLPGIADGFTINTAITLPIGMEAYAAYALWVWLGDRAPRRARRFARWSALLALAVGAAGQIAFHLMAAAGITTAPWQITTAVACLPVAVLGMGAALAHLLHTDDDT